MKNIISFLFIVSNMVYFLNGQGIEKVQKVGERPLKSQENQFIYSLPRTSLQIKVFTSRNITFSGPYFAYTEEMLGIKGAPSENMVEWHIDSISISAFLESDPDEFYSITTEKGFNPRAISELTKAGYILMPDFQNFNCIENISITKKNNSLPFGFIELSMQSTYFPSADTFYKTILKDSVYINIPVIKQKTSIRTLKDKAKEAVDVIMKIRQRRFELILSEDVALPEVKAFRMDLDEMQKLEDSYLALFLGKKVVENHINSFYFSPPASTSRDNQFEIFRFSSKSGISDRTYNLATPVLVTFTKDGNTKVLNEWLHNVELPTKNHLFYRIPDAAITNILWKGDLLASKKILFYQFGTILPMPFYIFK